MDGGWSVVSVCASESMGCRGCTVGCSVSKFEGVTTSGEAFTGAAGERRTMVVRESEWREGNEHAKMQVGVW